MARLRHSILQSADPQSITRSPDHQMYNSPMSHAFTIGVEEEFQIVDPTTWELRSHVSALLASSAETFGENIKPELHQSIVEVGTKICSGVDELCEESSAAAAVSPTPPSASACG